MESLEDLLVELEKEKDKYCASFDLETGKVLSVGPAVCFNDIKNKIDLDKETAEDILLSKIQISNCFVDIQSGNFEIVEMKSIVKIDDVLHRVPLIDYVDDLNEDLFIVYEKDRKNIYFELSESIGGTRKTNQLKTRNVRWSDDTVMHFYLTKYNDPHWIYNHFSFSFSELYKNKKIYENIDLPSKFSIFTRRILKNYVIEIK